MTFAHDETIWRDAYPGEPRAKKVRRIREHTGMSVQEIADRLGLNRIGPENEQHREQHTREEERRAWQERVRREAEDKLRAAAEWHAQWEARREKVNGKAGRGNPKIDRARLFALRASGLGVRAIARELGCSHVAVMKIIRATGNQCA